MASNEHSGRTNGVAATRAATRRTALIIWWVLVAGALGLAVVAAIFGPGIWPRVSDAGKVVAWAAFGMSLACLLASSVLPSRIKPPGATVESIAVTRSVVATTFNGSIALFAPLAWMVSGKLIALVALAISLVGLLLAFPSERRWQKLCRRTAASRGQELVAGAEVPTPQPPLRRPMAWAVVILVLTGTILVLMSNIFWTTEVLRRPANPITGAVMTSILALLMGGFAVVRFKQASAAGCSRWYRVDRILVGIVLLALAGYLLALAVRIASRGW